MPVRNGKGRFVSSATMTERVKELKRAGFTLGYAWRDDAKRFGHVYYLHYSNVTGEYSGGYRLLTVSDGDSHASYGDPYVSFGSIARGVCAYGDSSTVVRSNYRSLRRDYPDFGWVDTSYTNVDVLGCFVADLDDDMMSTLVGLADGYPVYDEDDMSALEHEQTSDSWHEHARSDLWRELPEVTRTIMWDALGEDMVTDLWWACVSYDVFNGYPEHNGIEVLWGDMRDRAKQFRPYLIHAYVSLRQGGILPAAWDMVRMVQRFRDTYREGRQKALERLWQAFMAQDDTLHGDGAWHRYLTERGWVHSSDGYIWKGSDDRD